MSARSTPIARSLVAAAALAAVLAAPARAADERLARLSPANRAIAERLLSSIGRWDQKYRDRAAALNGGPAPDETLHTETDYSIYDVWVSRGPVVAKLGRMLAEAKQPQPGRPGPPLVWSRFYSLDWHARTPRVGMLHSALVLQFYEDGSGFVGGWLGVMNGTRNGEDMGRLAKVVDERFARHGKSPELYRDLMLRGPENAVRKYLREPDPSGVSLYGPPLYPGDTAKSFDMAAELFEAFDDAYVEILAKRAKEPFTPEDVARRDAMRRRWLTDQLYADPFSSKVVPFEVWSLSDMPPEVAF